MTIDIPHTSNTAHSKCFDAIAAGYEDLNDHQRLRNDPVIQAVGEHLGQGANTRFIATNLSGKPQHLYDDTYCQRGDMENRIKEQQLDLFSDRTSCHEFNANQFRVFLSAAAYVLIEKFRREYLKDTELARAQVGTIRIKLLKVAARVVHRSSRILFHICSSYPYYQLLTKLICKLIPRLNPSFNFT